MVFDIEGAGLINRPIYFYQNISQGQQPRMAIDTDGQVGIGTQEAAGALDVYSTTGAFIVPRMTTGQRDALTAINGMIIYNVTTNAFNFYENGAWVAKQNQ